MKHFGKNKTFQKPRLSEENRQSLMAVTGKGFVLNVAVWVECTVELHCRDQPHRQLNCLLSS